MGAVHHRNIDTPAVLQRRALFIDRNIDTPAVLQRRALFIDRNVESLQRQALSIDQKRQLHCRNTKSNPAHDQGVAGPGTWTCPPRPEHQLYHDGDLSIDRLVDVRRFAEPRLHVLKVPFIDGTVDVPLVLQSQHLLDLFLDGIVDICRVAEPGLHVLRILFLEAPLTIQWLFS